MSLRNTEDWYGRVNQWIHWLMALIVFGLFGLGLYMRDLDYYDPMYQIAPNIHKSFGVVLILLLILRIVWRLFNVKPRELDASKFEHFMAKLVHVGLYLLLILLSVTGYIYSTGDGKPLVVFNLFELPSFYTNKDAANGAGDFHEILAYAIMVFAALHVVGALKHHFIDQDDTLRRMVRRSHKN